jgi:hypothetical protein
VLGRLNDQGLLVYPDDVQCIKVEPVHGGVAAVVLGGRDGDMLAVHHNEVVCRVPVAHKHAQPLRAHLHALQFELRRQQTTVLEHSVVAQGGVELVHALPEGGRADVVPCQHTLEVDGVVGLGLALEGLAPHEPQAHLP